MMELPEVIACMPRMPGGWQHFSSLLAFVFLAWAFRHATHPKLASSVSEMRSAADRSARVRGARVRGA